MKKDQTNSKSRSKKNQGEIEATIVPDEKDVLDDGGQALDQTPAHGDTEQGSSSESPADEERESDHSQNNDEEPLSIPDELPILPLKDTVIYPFAVQPLGVGQERSIRLIDDVMRGNRLVVLVAQKSAEIEQAGPDDIFKIGTVSRIARMIRMPDGTIQIIVQGLERVAIGEFTQEKPYLVARITLKPDIQEEDDETEAIKRNVVGYFQQLVALVQNLPEGVAAAALNLEEARQVVYVIATFVQMELELRQKLLELDSVRAKLENLSSFLAHELEIFELGKKIQTSAQEKIKDRILEYLAVRRLKEERMAEQEQRQMEAVAEESDERRTTTEPLLSAQATRLINREPILCFVGPPGVGKTSLGQSIARAL